MSIPETIVQLRLSEGRMIQTFASVLQHDPESLFAELLSDESIRDKQLVRLECSHRDKRMLNYIVDCLRKFQNCPIRCNSTNFQAKLNSNRMTPILSSQRPKISVLMNGEP